MAAFKNGLPLIKIPAMKVFILFSLLFLSAAYVSAQDSLYTTDGKVIGAKVIEINSSEIKYKKSSNPDGPLYVIAKSDVALIEYQNGSKDIFAKSADTSGQDADATSQSQNQGQNQAVIVRPRPVINVVVGALPMLAFNTLGCVWGNGWGWGGGWYRPYRNYNHYGNYGHHGHYGRRGGRH